MNQNSA
jgi:hypothetical protein